MLLLEYTHLDVAGDITVKYLIMTINFQDSRGRYGWRYLGFVFRICKVYKSVMYSHYKNHLLLQFAVIIILGADLPVEVQQFLQSLVLRGHDILYDWHK